MTVRDAKIDELTQDGRNANKGTERGRYMLDHSLRQFGAGRSILVDKHGKVIAGNKTLEAAADIGMDNVVVVQTDGTQLVAVQRTDLDLDDGDRARLMAYADNRAGEVGLEWDTEQMAVDLGEGVDLSALFKDDELIDLGAMTPEVAVDPGAQIDKAEELQQKWQVQQGQIWEIPSKSVEGAVHRLMCGDSTKVEDVARVMQGERAELCFTSPPYDQQREYENGIGAWLPLMQGVFSSLPMADVGQVLVNLGLIHQEGEWIPYWESWIDWMRQQGWRRFGWYVWDQGPGLPGDWAGRLAPAFEFVFHFNRKAIKPNKTQDCKYAGMIYEGKGGLRAADGVVSKWSHRNRPVQESKIPDSICRSSREKSSYLYGHPAMFSVGFALYFIEAWDGVVYDPFLGSGTTMVACEQLGRKCRGIEIEPKYCAVTLERMAGMGLEPKRVSND